MTNLINEFYAAVVKALMDPRQEDQLIKIEDKLDKAFYALSEQIYDYLFTDDVNKEAILKECVALCYDKLPKFDTAKNAFNYFSTIIIARMKEIRRIETNYKKVERKYNLLQKNEIKFIIHVRDVLGQ